MKPLNPLFNAIFLILLSSSSFAGVTKVGNGDEGSDLEGATEIKSGPLSDARNEAVKLLRTVNTPGVSGLGMLLPELQSSPLFLTKKDSTDLESTDQGAFHADMKGRVYARTFAEPHASTRFFPVAKNLDRDQLVALHVHEALHRSLPTSVREDESIVSGLTLAITAPGANFDSVDRAAKKWIPSADRGILESPQETAPAPETYPIGKNAKVKNPSEFSYSYHRFRKPKEYSQFPVDSMHVIRSDLYPFGSDTFPLGIGIEASLINRPKNTLMGPLSLSARMKVWSSRGFDVGVWGVASLNMLSNDELKNSQFGRDTYSVGVSMRKDLEHFSVENFLGYTEDGESTSKIGNVDYLHEYGSIVTASTHPALLLGNFRLGGFLSIALGDYYRLSGGAFNDYNPGRYRIISAGPEVQYRFGNVAVGVSGRFLVNATNDASFDTLGDLLGSGAAQGDVAATLSVSF